MVSNPLPGTLDFVEKNLESEIKLILTSVQAVQLQLRVLLKSRVYANTRGHARTRLQRDFREQVNIELSRARSFFELGRSEIEELVKQHLAVQARTAPGALIRKATRKRKRVRAR